VIREMGSFFIIKKEKINPQLYIDLSYSLARKSQKYYSDSDASDAFLTGFLKVTCLS